MTTFFILTTVICAIGWATRYISTLSVIYYMEKKGYTQPNDKEIKECTQWVIKKILKVK